VNRETRRSNSFRRRFSIALYIRRLLARPLGTIFGARYKRKGPGWPTLFVQKQRPVHWSEVRKHPLRVRFTVIVNFKTTTVDERKANVRGLNPFTDAERAQQTTRTRARYSVGHHQTCVTYS